MPSCFAPLTNTPHYQAFPEPRQSDRWQTLSWCSFHLHLSNYESRWASSHMLQSHLYFLLGSSDYLNMMSRWKFFFFLDGSLSKPLSVCLSPILLPVPLCVPITGLELVGGVGQDSTIPELGAVATPSAGWSSGLHTWPYLAHTWPGPVHASVLLCSCELGLEGQGQRCLPQGKGPQ